MFTPSCDHPLSASAIRRQWPFLNHQDVESIDGRVDQLYRVLIARRVSRGEAAKQIHALLQSQHCGVES